MNWQTSKRTLDFSKPLIMGILNVTPDSFSDGGKFATLDAALSRVEEMIAEGVDIIDIGGESTRPGSGRVDAQLEIDRTAPVIEAISSRFDIPVSIDTSKSSVAAAAVESGAEIINDISGLRFDPDIANIASQHITGLVLMHSCGEFETMHSQPPVDNIFYEVVNGLRESGQTATERGVDPKQIVLDVGVGFGKTVDQNLELIARSGEIGDSLGFATLVGASRKSFIPKALGRDIEPRQRLAGSLAAAILAVKNGAAILRVHDIRETIDTLSIASLIEKRKVS